MNTTNAPADHAAEVTARFVAEGIRYELTHNNFRMGACFATNEDAQAFIALFPKSVGLKVMTFVAYDMETQQFVKMPDVGMFVNLHATKATGEMNETGVKRIRRFITGAIAHGLPLTQRMTGSDYMTVEEFMKATN